MGKGETDNGATVLYVIQLSTHTRPYALRIDGHDKVKLVLQGVADLERAMFAMHPGDVGGAVELAQLVDSSLDPIVDLAGLPHINDGRHVLVALRQRLDRRIETSLVRVSE